MAKVLRLNYLVFIVLYCFYLKVETKSDVMVPSLSNMVEYDHKPYLVENSLPQYDRYAVNVQRSNAEDADFPKLKKKKQKKKIRNKKSSNYENLADNEITEKVRTKKFKKKKSRKFTKTAPKDNSIESGESKKRSPVDIIVHIKMTE